MDFSDDDAQDYLNDFKSLVESHLKVVLPEEVAVLATEVLVESYEFRDLLANLWDDAYGVGYKEGVDDARGRDTQHQTNPFHNECCPRTKGGGHKFRCSKAGVQQMVVPAYVTESNEIKVSEVWRKFVFDRPLDAEEPQD